LHDAGDTTLYAIGVMAWEVQAHVRPGKVPLIAEIEKERAFPFDEALETVEGQVFRHSRSELAELQCDHDFSTVKAEIRDLGSEASHTSGTAKSRLQDKLAATKARIEDRIKRVKGACRDRGAKPPRHGS
jgi:hypothetical protein